MEAMLSFSPIGAEMAEVHVYLSLFAPVFVWGGGGDRFNQLGQRLVLYHSSTEVQRSTSAGNSLGIQGNSHSKNCRSETCLKGICGEGGRFTI